jgi:hypothetical protein
MQASSTSLTLSDGNIIPLNNIRNIIQKMFEKNKLYVNDKKVLRKKLEKKLNVSKSSLKEYEDQIGSIAEVTMLHLHRIQILLMNIYCVSY